MSLRIPLLSIAFWSPRETGSVVAAKSKQLPAIEQREVIDGTVHAYDREGRLCLDIENRERIVLVHDLRIYGDDLHIGALGWTILKTTDRYTFADVIFDTGQKLRLKRYAFERVTVESAKAVTDTLIADNRNTRFDADPVVAASCREDWIAKYYGEYLTLSETMVKGIGDQKLYAFTFPSLIELATVKGVEHYPVKVGFSKNSSDGAFGRIRSQILEKVGFPEKPKVLLVFRTWDGRQLETQVQERLRSLGRKAPDSLGREWLMTSTGELLRTIDECDLADLPPDRLITGADETIEEGFAGLMAGGPRSRWAWSRAKRRFRLAIGIPTKRPNKGMIASRNRPTGSLRSVTSTPGRVIPSVRQ